MAREARDSPGYHSHATALVLSATALVLSATPLIFGIGQYLASL